MNKYIRKIPILLIVSSTASMSTFADVESDLKRLEQEIATIRQQANIEDKNIANKDKIGDKSLTIYGTFRPVLTVEDDGTDTIMDIRDALSRFGLTGSTSILDSSQAFFTGEWNVKIADDGQIEGARLAFVGLSGPLGRVAIGKQRPAQYNLIAEHVDIFNHASSPFAYDSIAPFFVSNTTSYQFDMNGLGFEATITSDGGDGKDTADIVNAGISYSIGNMYVATAYLKSTNPSAADAKEEGDEKEITALAGSATMSDLYLAAAYQMVTLMPEIGVDEDVSTLDISASYSLPSRYKVKAGIFVYDHDDDLQKYNGFNLTLERQLTDNVRVHTELLNKTPDQGDAINGLSFGIRYDFSADL